MNKIRAKQYKKIGPAYWSARLPGKFTYDEAIALTAKQFEAFVGKPPHGFTWKLPSEDDFETAEKHGLREILPYMAKDWFWTSSPSSLAGGGARLFSGYDGVVDLGYRYGPIAVVCIGVRKCAK